VGCAYKLEVGNT